MNQTTKRMISLAASVVGLVVLIALAVFAYGQFSNSVDNGPLESPQKTPSKAASDFTVTDSQGNSVKLSDSFGKPIVVNFWASWCGPCQNEMPEFNKVYAEFKDSVVFLMVDLVDGQQETTASGKAFVNKKGYTFPLYFDTLGEASKTYKISSIPQTYFIDKDGLIVKSFIGGLNEKTLRQYIEMMTQD